MTDEHGTRYNVNDQEFNLARMHADTIRKAYRRYPGRPQHFICRVLGVSERTLLRMMGNYGLSTRELKKSTNTKINRL
jgi:hypothetical protein